MAKIQLQDFVHYGKLFEIYGKLLSDDRQNIMTDYFQFNMTLVEIAKERNISRQAVLDAIDKSCQKLEKFEKLLQVGDKKEKLMCEVEQLLQLAKNLKQQEIIEKVEKIYKEI
ncbi:MAG: hypothetical protein J6J24_01950 [Clostridia bacterium]|nr:hypothetical protein [Clostridia bacterium]